MGKYLDSAPSTRLGHHHALCYANADIYVVSDYSQYCIEMGTFEFRHEALI